MSENSSDSEFDRPFPAMTPGQRYHLDVFGYVVIENTLTEEETGRLLEAMQRLKTDLLAVEPDAYVRGCRLGAHRPHYLHFAHILEADPAIYDYLTHPRLVGLAEELVGGIVRLEESEAIINERDPDAEPDGRYGFHVGTWPDLGTYTENGLFHCTFVKTLTNLTELGPDDGGTVVVAGSHKLKAPREEIPASAYEDGAPLIPDWVFERRLPILGICYGMQALVHQLGGKVAPGAKQEFGSAVLHQDDAKGALFNGLPPSFQVWMSHGDQVESLPPGFASLAYTENSPVAAIGNGDNMFGLQFHPEVNHTPLGQSILENFLFRACGCVGTWTPGNVVADSITRIREQVGDGRGICALSGGVDSAVTAGLLHRAVGDQLTCIFVDNGVMRREEPQRVRNTFERHLSGNLVFADASERFLSALKGVVDPAQKRRIIGAEFIGVFEEEAARLGQVDFLVQGTLYPAVIERELRC